MPKDHSSSNIIPMVMLLLLLPLH